MELTQQDKKYILSKIGSKPGSKGTITCPVCTTNLLHWEVSAFNGKIKAYCDNALRRCVQWEE